VTAASFGAPVEGAASIGALIDDAKKRLGGADAAIVFASGKVAESAAPALTALTRALGDIPIVLGCTAGVLCERGEYEGVSAMTGLLWKGGTVTPLVVPARTGVEQIGPQLSQQVAAALGDAAGTVVLLAEPQGLAGRTLDELVRCSAHATIVGGGTLPGGAWARIPGGQPLAGSVVGLAIRGVVRPAVSAASACRLLAPLMPITEARGAVVTRLGERPALDTLSECSRDLTGRPLVLAVIGQPELAAGVRGTTIVRGIRGIDPERRAVVVSDEAAPGKWMTFAVCDPSASRAELVASLRDLARQMAGAAPQFGLFFNCAGRGAGLYGDSNVDTRLVRERFGQVPLAGMFSTFEIGPFAGRAVMHLYTGVLAMFGAPS
jgi:small ligand-binding sensory domain FIST